LQRTTRAEGCPFSSTVASTMELGLGWDASACACANHCAAISSGLAGKGSGSVSVHKGFMLVLIKEW